MNNTDYFYTFIFIIRLFSELTRVLKIVYPVYFRVVHRYRVQKNIEYRTVYRLKIKIRIEKSFPNSLVKFHFVCHHL